MSAYVDKSQGFMFLGEHDRVVDIKETAQSPLRIPDRVRKLRTTGASPAALSKLLGHIRMPRMAVSGGCAMVAWGRESLLPIECIKKELNKLETLRAALSKELTELEKLYRKK